MEFYESVQGYIATECPVCGVRLYFRPEQAGTAIRCGMCLQSLEIPTEIKVRPKPRPVQRRAKPYGIDEDYDPLEEREPGPAVNDEPRTGTYSFAEPDEPPPSAEPAAASPSSCRHQGADAPRSPTGEETKAEANRSDAPAPKRASRRNKDLIPVECPKCNNRMYARKDQVGEKMGCADCGTVIVVPQPRAEVVRKLEIPKPVAVSAEEPPERPHDDRLIRTQMLPEPPPPPEPPKWTFFSGVVSFLWKGKGPLYVAVLSLGFLLMGEIAAVGLWMQAVLTRMGGPVAGRSGLAMAFVLLVIPALLTLSQGAACFFAVMQDTANGGDEITSWPEATFVDRLGVLGRLVYLSGLAAMFGYLFAQVAAAILGGNDAMWWALGAFLWLPFLVTSSLESQRTAFPFSAVVFASLVHLWWGWLLMYLQSGLLCGICAAAFLLTFEDMPSLTPLWTAPLLAAAVLICARLCGRILWRTMTYEVDTEARPKDDPWM